MRIASIGQRSAHSAQPVQPVQPVASSSTARLMPQPLPGSTCSDSTCGGQAATHQPQPVQRFKSMAGKALEAPGMGPSMARAPGDGSVRGQWLRQAKGCAEPITPPPRQTSPS